MSLYNLRNPAVKRLMREAEELQYPTKEYHAQPLEDNLFEWHFTLSGPPNTDFEGGIYHGRITLPPDYPMKPPSIILLTPNGRFETNKKICLSISGYHPESWQPSWSIRTALLAIIGFLPTHGNGAIGSLDYTPEERKELALKSQDWKCSACGYIKQYLAKSEKEASVPQSRISAVKTESLTEVDNPSSPCESTRKLSNSINFVREEKEREELLQPDIPDSPKDKSKVAPAPLSRKEEALLRHKQQIALRRNSQRNAESAAVGPVCGNWSLGAMWVIVILLGILIFRRMISLE